DRDVFFQLSLPKSGALHANINQRTGIYVKNVVDDVPLRDVDVIGNRDLRFQPVLVQIALAQPLQRVGHQAVGDMVAGVYVSDVGDLFWSVTRIFAHGDLAYSCLISRLDDESNMDLLREWVRLFAFADRSPVVAVL